VLQPPSCQFRFVRTEHVITIRCHKVTVGDCKRLANVRCVKKRWYYRMLFVASPLGEREKTEVRGS